MAEEADPSNEVVVEVEVELVAHFLPVFTVMRLTYLPVSINDNTAIRRFVIWATNISIRVNAHPAVRRHVSHLYFHVAEPYRLSFSPIFCTFCRSSSRIIDRRKGCQNVGDAHEVRVQEQSRKRYV